MEFPKEFFLILFLLLLLIWIKDFVYSYNGLQNLQILIC